VQCTQQDGEELGGVVDARNACASGTANFASFTSQYGTDFIGIPSSFSRIGKATAGLTSAAVNICHIGSLTYFQNLATSASNTGSTGSAAPTAGLSGAQHLGFSSYNLAVIGFAMVLGIVVLS
jgi:hypothetical protein